MDAQTSNSKHAGRRLGARVIGAALVSALLGATAFMPALHNEFVYDDLPIIVENPTITAPGPWYRFWREPWWPRGTSNDRLYRPLTLWSFRVNLLAAGKLSRINHHEPVSTRGQPARPQLPESAAFWFHLVNLVLHGLTCAGVALLAFRLSGRTAAALIAGVLFATHPVHTEAVVTGYGRAELLAGFFSVWLLARHCRSPVPGLQSMSATIQSEIGNRKSEMTSRGVKSTSPNPVAAAPRGGRAPARRRCHTGFGTHSKFHAMSGLLLLAALMSKEHAIFVWPVLLVYDLWRRRACGPRASRPTRREWLNHTLAPAHVPFALAAAVFFFLRFSVFGWKGRIPGADLPYWQSPLGHAGLIEHVLTPFRLAWLTLELLVWPPRLCPIWSVPALPLAGRLSADVVGGILLVIAVLTAAVVLWRRSSVGGPLLLGLLMVLALPLQAIPLAHWLFAERWLYLPSVLIAVLIGLTLARRAWPTMLLALALAILLLPASWSYSGVFHDGLTLLHDVVRRQPDNLQGQKNLTGALLLAGDPAAVVQTGREAIERFGDIPEVHLYMAMAYLRLGNGAASIRALDDYLRSSSHRPGPSYGELRREAELLIQQRNASASAPARTAATPQ